MYASLEGTSEKLAYLEQIIAVSSFSEYTLINLNIIGGVVLPYTMYTAWNVWLKLLAFREWTVTLFTTRSARSSLRDKRGNLAGQVRPVRPSVYRGWRGLWPILCWWPSPGWRRQLNALFRSINPHGCSSCRDVPSSSSLPLLHACPFSVLAILRSI